MQARTCNFCPRSHFVLFTTEPSWKTGNNYILIVGNCIGATLTMFVRQNAGPWPAYLNLLRYELVRCKGRPSLREFRFLPIGFSFDTQVSRYQYGPRFSEKFCLLYLSHVHQNSAAKNSPWQFIYLGKIYQMVNLVYKLILRMQKQQAAKSDCTQVNRHRRKSVLH